jgi:hypothetical protein
MTMRLSVNARVCLNTAFVRTKAQNVIGVAQVGVTLFFRYEDFKFS